MDTVTLCELIPFGARTPASCFFCTQSAHRNKQCKGRRCQGDWGKCVRIHYNILLMCFSIRRRTIIIIIWWPTPMFSTCWFIFIPVARIIKWRSVPPSPALTIDEKNVKKYTSPLVRWDYYYYCETVMLCVYERIDFHCKYVCVCGSIECIQHDKYYSNGVRRIHNTTQ